MSTSADKPDWMEPDWPAPANVCAASTLRTGGVSVGPFASLNLGAHVGDDPAAVAENRARLRAALELEHEPLWLNQVHGTQIVEVTRQDVRPTADAALARHPGRACAILTADCLPVLFCNREGTRVAAAHAGWRGLVGGVLAATVAAVGVEPATLMAWLGPAIEQPAFEVGDDVRDAFIARDAANAAGFIVNERMRWEADLYLLARHELTCLGVRDVYGGGYRCYADAARYFSYRRDGRTGRMATLIWLAH